MKNRTKKPNKIIPFKTQMDKVCSQLLDTVMSAKDNNMITGIQNWCSRTGKISSKQLSQLGRCSKLYLQNGQYEQHNWWS